MAVNTLTKPIRSNWNISTRVDSANLYALALIDLRKVAGENIQNIQAANNPNLKEFIFKMNPKSMNLDEPAAVTIVPTQDGGQFIEHQGQIYKNVSISGTTGLRPNKRAGGTVIPVIDLRLPFSNGFTNVDTGLPSGETTGFDDFIELRNLFRHYFDMKVDPNNAPHIIMIWKNGKESEFYVVEPMSFRTNRDASSPVTFAYDIQLRTITRFELELQNKKDPYRIRKSINKFSQVINNLRTNLIDAFTFVSSVVNSITTLGVGSMNLVLTSVNTVIQGLTGIVTAGTKFGLTNLQRTELAATANISYNAARLIDASQEPTYSNNILTSMITAANQLKNIGRNLQQISTIDSLFQPPTAQSLDDKRRAYNNPFTGPPITGGSQLDLNNTALANSSGVATVNTGENIYGVTQRLLGDATRYKELVLLNKLKPPYISEAGDGINVLRPFDQIIFPRASSDLNSTVISKPSKYTNLSQLDVKLGRDLKLVSKLATAGIQIYDLDVDSSGDLATISGVSNMEQAIVIKFATEQGELPLHSFFGVLYPIGSKLNIQSFVEFQLNTTATLLSDSRIGDITSFNASAEGDVIQTKVGVAIKDFNENLVFSYTTGS